MRDFFPPFDRVGKTVMQTVHLRVTSRHAKHTQTGKEPNYAIMILCCETLCWVGGHDLIWGLG